MNQFGFTDLKRRHFIWASSTEIFQPKYLMLLLFLWDKLQWPLLLDKQTAFAMKTLARETTIMICILWVRCIKMCAGFNCLKINAATRYSVKVFRGNEF